jgi:hypothetical protein
VVAWRTLGLPTAPVGLKTTFLWEVANYFDVDERGITLADWFGPVSKLGGSSFYLAAFFDSEGSPLQGASADVPVKELWSISANRVRYGDISALPQF